MTEVVLAAVSNGLCSALVTEGREVVEIGSAEDLTTKVRDPNAIAFAVVDETLECAVDVMVHIKSKLDGADHDRVPILTVGDVGHAMRVEPDARLRGDGNTHQINAAAQQIRYRRARQRRLFDQEVRLKVPTTPENVERAGDLLEQIVATVGYEEEDEVKLGNTLREALGNAAEHGNKNDPQRTVHIHFLRTPDRVTFVFTDEGPGFDTSSFLARADEVSALEHTRSRRANEARPGGLGVFIMKQTCDDIQFNAKGNAIYLMKFLPNNI